MLAAPKQLVALKPDEGGWPPAKNFPAGGKQRLSHWAKKTAAAKIILGWTTGAEWRLKFLACEGSEIKARRAGIFAARSTGGVKLPIKVMQTPNYNSVSPTQESIAR
jgi:hypothetical protein